MIKTIQGVEMEITWDSVSPYEPEAYENIQVFIGDQEVWDVLSREVRSDIEQLIIESRNRRADLEIDDEETAA